MSAPYNPSRTGLDTTATNPVVSDTGGASVVLAANSGLTRYGVTIRNPSTNSGTVTLGRVTGVVAGKGFVDLAPGSSYEAPYPLYQGGYFAISTVDGETLHVEVQT